MLWVRPIHDDRLVNLDHIESIEITIQGKSGTAGPQRNMRRLVARRGHGPAAELTASFPDSETGEPHPVVTMSLDIIRQRLAAEYAGLIDLREVLPPAVEAALSHTSVTVDR